MTDDKISHEEMQQWFPEGVPMEIYNLIFGADDALTIGEIRQQIRDFVSKHNLINVLVGVIAIELRRQSEDPDRQDSPYVREDEPHKPLIDGWIDLRDLARAVLEGMPK